MGYNTTVVIYNDALDQIANDLEFGKKLVDAILKLNNKNRSSITGMVFSGNGSAAQVIESHHADILVKVLVGNNTGIVIN